MTNVFTNTQIPLGLNTPEDFCIDDSVHLLLQATRRNENPLADLLDRRHEPCTTSIGSTIRTFTSPSATL